MTICSLQVFYHWSLHWLFLICLDSVTMSPLLVISFSNSPSEPPLMYALKRDHRKVQESHTIVYYSGVTWDSMEHLELTVHTNNKSTVIWNDFIFKCISNKSCQISLSYLPQVEALNLSINCEPRKLQSNLLPLCPNCS